MAVTARNASAVDTARTAEAQAATYERMAFTLDAVLDHDGASSRYALIIKADDLSHFQIVIHNSDGSVRQGCKTNGIRADADAIAEAVMDALEI